MPCRYHIDKERGLVLTTAWDCVTFSEIEAHANQLLNDPNFNPEFNQLVDGTGVTELAVSVDELQKFAQRATFSRGSRRALVVSNPAVFGMMRVFEAHHELGKSPSQVAVFYDLPSALEWLGLDETALK